VASQVAAALRANRDAAARQARIERDVALVESRLAALDDEVRPATYDDVCHRTELFLDRGVAILSSARDLARAADEPGPRAVERKAALWLARFAMRVNDLSSVRLALAEAGSLSDDPERRAEVAALDSAARHRAQALFLLTAATGYRTLGDAVHERDAIDRAVSIAPDFPAVWHVLALFCLHQGDAVGARDAFSRAYELEPRWQAALASRATVRALTHDAAGGLADAERALALDPKFGSAWYSRGVARRELGDRAGAIADFSRALEVGFSDDQMGVAEACRESLAELRSPK
jgi:tetratricopeptide (TPR) repeat protein